MTVLWEIGGSIGELLEMLLIGVAQKRTASKNGLVEAADPFVETAGLVGPEHRYCRDN